MKRLFFLIPIFIVLTSIGMGQGQIQIAYSPYTIFNPGSYLAVKDLSTDSAINCITILASNVSINLNGHTLYGPGTTIGITGDGIHADSTYANIAIFNGTVRNFPDDGLDIRGRNAQISNIKALQNRDSGIYIEENGVVSKNIADDNNGSGIRAGDGCVVIHNSSRSNEVGVSVSNGCTVMGNSILQNKGTGIMAAKASLIKDNSIKNNLGNGIQIQSNCRVTDNICDNSGFGASSSAGIYATGSGNDIENNLVTNNGIGILISGSSNFFASNRASSNTLSNYTSIAGNVNGGTTSSALTNFTY